MKRPKIKDCPNAPINSFNYKQESYIDYLELRVTRLTEGLNDIVTTLQNMQRDGKES